MPTPLGKNSFPPPTCNPTPKAKACQSSSAPGRSIPPLPGHSPGQLSALFLALWKGLFFFLFPWKGRHNPTTLRLIPDPEPYKNRLSPPFPNRDPLPWPCPDPSLLGHQEPPPLSGSQPRSSGSSWAQHVCRGGGWGGEGGRRPLPTPSFPEGGGSSSLLGEGDRPTLVFRDIYPHALSGKGLPPSQEWAFCSYIGGKSSQLCKEGSGRKGTH